MLKGLCVLHSCSMLCKFCAAANSVNVYGGPMRHAASLQLLHMYEHEARMQCRPMPVCLCI